jgi:hypothetical protein
MVVVRWCVMSYMDESKTDLFILFLFKKNAVTQANNISQFLLFYPLLSFGTILLSTKVQPSTYHVPITIINVYIRLPSNMYTAHQTCIPWEFG